MSEEFEGKKPGKPKLEIVGGTEVGAEAKRLERPVVPHSKEIADLFDALGKNDMTQGKGPYTDTKE